MAGLQEEFQLVHQKGGLDIDMAQIGDLTEGGAQAAVEMGIGFDEDLPSLESNGVLAVDDVSLSVEP